MTAEHSSREGKYYTDSEIAGLLGISLGRLRNKLSAGHPLPPRIQPPGCRNRLWCCEGVHEWLAQFTVTVSSSVHDQVPRRRGRPKNSKYGRAGHQHRRHESGFEPADCMSIELNSR